MLLTIVVFVLVLSVIVFSHELGHFFTARFFGAKIEEFGFGLPPRIFGVYRNRLGKRRYVRGSHSIDPLFASDDKNIQPAEKATIYSLNWLPVGGFVKIKGENGAGKNEADSFATKKIWQRVLILSAGVIMNIVLAWFLFSAGYMIGLPQSNQTPAHNAILSQQKLVVVQVVANSPAAKAGLKTGDDILSVNKQPLTSQSELQAITQANSGKKINVLIQRNKQEKNIAIIPVQNIKDGRAEIGVGVFSGGLVRYPFWSAIWQGLRTTIWLSWEIVAAFVTLFASLFSGHGIGGQFAGPIGIAGLTGQMARLGFSYLIQFTAFLSLNLAILNILPFPALDGGRIVFLIIEKFKGKPVRAEVEAVIHNIGFFLLIALVIFVTYKDIIRLF